MWKYLCYAVGLIFGSVMLFGGAYVLNSMPDLFAGKIKSQLPIVKGTDAWTRYTTPSVPLSVKVYMFNVTNAKEVTEKGAKPILNQVGPFAMSERRRRDIVAVSPDNRTLDYRLIRSFFFSPNESIPLNISVTMPNVPVVSAVFGGKQKLLDDDNDVTLRVLSDYIANESLYLTHTAEEWLFKGIKLDWLDALNDIGGIFPPETPPNNTFGLFYMKNNTWDERADGTMTISTGADGNFANIGQVVRWNNKNTTTFWRGPSCNSVKGTDGQFFHPFVQKDERLDIFAPDLCRTLSIEFVKTTSIRSIELYRFGISSSFFKPIDYDDETKCYCVRHHTAKKRVCKLGGIIDVSTCRNKPIILSTPHFYNGDPILREAFEGLAPSAANHDTFIDIEPMTGQVLRVRRRLQVNVDMESNEAFPGSSKLNDKKLIHPFIWLDQSITIPDELAQRLENKLTKMVRMVRILCYAALITGPIILIATLIFICRDISSEEKKIKRSSKKGPNSNKDTGGDYQKVHVIMKPPESLHF